MSTSVDPRIRGTLDGTYKAACGFCDSMFTQYRSVNHLSAKLEDHDKICSGRASRPETRVVDPVTGGAKGQKDVQLSMCPPAFLEDLGRVYAMGASKYDRNNWKKGYAWSLSVDALLRHLLRVLNGEWTDTESGLPHIIHVAWHCATLHTFHREGLGTNDVW